MFELLLEARELYLQDVILNGKRYDRYVDDFINTLHEKTSVIITTNKSPTEWAKDMNDEVLTTALLDRLLYHCEVIKLDGNSYRMENRKTIFKKKEV